VNGKIKTRMSASPCQETYNHIHMHMEALCKIALKVTPQLIMDDKNLERKARKW
jgi:hypothetical protein